eukprot:jgi/Mesvir1/7692/Mv11657-RA.1
MSKSKKFHVEEKSAVSVCTRFRPLNEMELAKSDRETVTFSDDGMSFTMEAPDDSANTYTFTFDRVFSQNSGQKEVFDYAARPVIEDVFNGYYATVFAYGQTGSGKTFTMEGVQGSFEERGVIPRAIEYLFDRVEAHCHDTDFTVGCTFVEIYMEKIRDLLDKNETNLEIRVDLNTGVYVEGARQVVVSNDAEVLELLARGSRQRHVGATGMNEESSRSHSIFTITVSQKDLKDLTVKTGRLFLVDLAGSEMVSKTGARDQRLEEAKQINKSLSALGNVIKALTDGKSTYIPYRDSKLTRILQDSLGGSSRTALIICCSPSAYNFQESLSTCRFGNRAKFIKNKPRQHVGYGGTELDELLAKREGEIARLTNLLDATKEELKSREEELARFRTLYGELPPLVLDEYGHPVETVPVPKKLQQHLDKAEQRCQRLEAVVRKTDRESKLHREGAIKFEQHVCEEKHLMGHARTVLTQLASALGMAPPRPVYNAGLLSKEDTRGKGVASSDDGPSRSTSREKERGAASPPSRKETEARSHLSVLAELLAVGAWQADEALKGLQRLAVASQEALLASSRYVAAEGRGLLESSGRLPATVGAVWGRKGITQYLEQGRHARQAAAAKVS